MPKHFIRLGLAFCATPWVHGPFSIPTVKSDTALNNFFQNIFIEISILDHFENHVKLKVTGLI